MEYRLEEIMTKIALVLPVLNQFRKCVEAIESAVTRYDLEIVIIDQYDHQRPLSAAWNLGIEKALQRATRMSFGPPKR